MAGSYYTSKLFQLVSGLKTVSRSSGTGFWFRNGFATVSETEEEFRRRINSDDVTDICSFFSFVSHFVLLVLIHSHKKLY